MSQVFAVYQMPLLVEIQIVASILEKGRFQVWQMKDVSAASMLDERISAVVLVQLIFCSDTVTCILYPFRPWTPEITIDLYILGRDKKFDQPNVLYKEKKLDALIIGILMSEIRCNK